MIRLDGRYEVEWNLATIEAPFNCGQSRDEANL